MSLSAAKDPDRLRAAKACLAAMLKGRPDTSVENPKYHIEMVEVLAHLSDADLAILSHPVTGLQTTLKYLPTPADVHGFLRDHRARKEQFEPAPTNYRKLNDEPKGAWDAETDYERKKRVVRELLGYDPDERGAPARKNRVPAPPPSPEDFASIKLTTPDKPVSRHLKALLVEQGYFDELRSRNAS